MNPTPLPNAYSHVPSPCVGVCRMDEADRRCVGCLRSRDEIGDWGRMSDRDKFRLWAQLTQRCKDLPTPPQAPVADA